MAAANTPYDVLALVHEAPERDEALAALRRDDPIQWDEENRWWLVTRHADVREVSRNPEVFSSEPKGPWHVAEHRYSMQAMEGLLSEPLSAEQHAAVSHSLTEHAGGH